MTQRILIVDDDPIQRRLLEEAVKKFGYDGRSLDGGKPAVSALASMPEDQPFDLVILDLAMPDMGGLQVLEALKAQRIEVPVVVQTANGGVDTAVSAMRAGAVDFVVKPVSPDRLETVIRTALKVNHHQDESKRAREESGGPVHFDQVITTSPAMDGVLKLAKKAAGSDIPVLIDGESGVGKELMARVIQSASVRAGKPFITVNCGAIPDNLVESILFGHEKGAFTGALDRHVGKFREAEGGTLFLDEVGELPQDVQVKLLRALQEGEIDPVGARKPVSVDFRLISATNRNLMEQVQNGGFREDLYYRLNVFPLNIPPLRERITDVPDLAMYFLKRFAAKEGKKSLKRIGPDAMELLTRYDWPGNIRQLENAVFRAVVLAETDTLTVSDFPQILAQVRHGHGLIGVAEVPRGEGAPQPVRQAGVPQPPDPVLIGQPAGAFAPSRDQTHVVPTQHNAVHEETPFGFLRAFTEEGHVKPLEALEKEAIANAVEHYGGRMAEVARRLGIGRSTLYRKLKDYGLEGHDDGGPIAAE